MVSRIDSLQFAADAERALQEAVADAIEELRAGALSGGGIVRVIEG